MDIRDLRYFETIAELEHMGQAAELLHRSQPTLTGCVQRLEASCGTALLEKAGRGIRLTPSGQVLLKWAQRIRNDVESARSEIDTIGHGGSGHVRVGVVPTVAHSLLPAAVRRLLAQAPAVTMKVVIGLVDLLMPMLRAGELDFMVGTEVPQERGMTSRLLTEDQVVVAASEDHEVFRSRPGLADLLRYRWVLQPPGAPTRDWLDHTFEVNYLPRPDVQIESSMLMALPSLIAETDLLSFVPRHYLALAQGRARLKEVSLQQTTMHRRLTVSHRESVYTPAVVEQLIGHFAAAARDWRPAS